MNLRSGLPFWLIRNGLTAVYPGLERDALYAGGRDKPISGTRS